MNIILIGMRGSGKSTTGKILAKKIGKTFVDTDALVVQKAGQSIAQLVAEKGWEYFRDLESQAVREIAINNNCIVSTGGGVILRPENVQALGKDGVFVYLRASVEALRSRITKGRSRPSLSGKQTAVDEVEEILLKRSPLYESTANIVVDTDELDPEQVADTVLKHLEK